MRFDNKFSLYSVTKDPLLVVTARLQGGKKHRATMIYGLTCLWDSGSTNIMIKRRHTKPYDRNASSNRVEFSIAVGPYCTTHDVKVTFCMPDFSSSKIILHHFNVDKNEGDSGIGYAMIFGHDLMVQLGISDDFKHQVLQWDGATVPMK